MKLEYLKFTEAVSRGVPAPPCLIIRGVRGTLLFFTTTNILASDLVRGDHALDNLCCLWGNFKFSNVY